MVPIDNPRRWPAAPSPVRPGRRYDPGRYDEDEREDIPTTGHVVLPSRRFALVRVRTFGDARAVAEHLDDRTPVLVDLSDVDTAMARRVVDFCSGIVFGIRGHIDRVDANVFLMVPAGVQTG
ncbi:cell division protein SepF [Mangrovactinospora gilvigrisea]|uniref:cell division protein SepF n=1 Tax=Mangrovactinospora gilvigrisea TaxID=1428644 RepID=UPI001FEA10EE|nr:cell division protein SepF [Mangrovactinospora gilvigrisea]